jgi:lipid-A-disaccharide synthase-like uncharacterized protein
MNEYVVYILGFLAQVMFFARTIAQWFKSEQAGEVMSPVMYWQISLAGSILMLTYGFLRNDFAIVFGQFIVYPIYIRNMQLKDAWRKMHFITRFTAVLIPLCYIGWLFLGNKYNLNSILKNEDVSLLLMIWGSAGQIIFTFRFIYQWIYSESRKDSVLPLGFWIISTFGSLMIFIYSIYRLDPVLFAAHSLGLFIYLRNILLHFGKRGLFSRLNNIAPLKEAFHKISDKIK